MGQGLANDKVDCHSCIEKGRISSVTLVSGRLCEHWKSSGDGREKEIFLRKGSEDHSCARLKRGFIVGKDLVVDKAVVSEGVFGKQDTSILEMCYFFWSCVCIAIDKMINMWADVR